MGRMILELDWTEESERWLKARNDKDFYTISYDGYDKFGNPKYSITNSQNGKDYKIYYSEHYQFCTCSDFIFRCKQDLVPCKHLYVTRWWLEANNLRPENLEIQKPYKVQPSEAFFRLQALKEQMQRDSGEKVKKVI